MVFTEAAHELVRSFYKSWHGGQHAQPGSSASLEQAQGGLLRVHAAEQLQALLPCLVQVLTREWPECRSFSGAVQKYLADEVLKVAAWGSGSAGRYAAQEQDTRSACRRREQEEFARTKAEQQQFRAVWEPRWLALADEEREALRAEVVAKHPVLRGSRNLLEEQCLRALAQRAEEKASVAKNPAQETSLFA